MFSDRGWILKLAAALGLFAWLCWTVRWRHAELFPNTERLAYYSDSLRGRMFFVWARRVEAQEPRGFQIPSSLGPIHVLSAAPPAVGEYVSLIGRGVGPRTLETVRLQINAGFAWKRPLNYAVSILTLIAYLWIVRRRFHWRIREGVFRSRF